MSADPEMGGNPTGGRAYTAAGSVAAVASAVAACGGIAGGGEGEGKGCGGGVAADTTTPVFSNMEGGSLEMPGMSAGTGSVAPALGVPSGETLFDPRGVILFTHTPMQTTTQT